MVALICNEWGPPAALTLGGPLAGLPGPGEVLIRAEAAALNFADTLVVSGKYQVKPPFPFTPGFEAAGVVEAVGASEQAYGRWVETFQRHPLRLQLHRLWPGP